MPGTKLFENGLRLALAAGFGWASIETMVGKAATNLMELVMPFAKRVQQLSKTGDVQTRSRP